jgi:hypothetical protein
LDDIGAESNNDWIRDNILQVILQYRMQENLPTFFTSNLTMDELEMRLAMTKKGMKLGPAKRVMERVRKLSREFRLEEKIVAMVNDTINLMMQHTSVRNFTDEKISVDILKTIIEAGRAASTWKNFQSYSIINISVK